jgi:hypothetical protein
MEPLRGVGLHTEPLRDNDPFLVVALEVHCCEIGGPYVIGCCIGVV